MNVWKSWRSSVLSMLAPKVPPKYYKKSAKHFLLMKWGALQVELKSMKRQEVNYKNNFKRYIQTLTYSPKWLPEGQIFDLKQDIQRLWLEELEDLWDTFTPRLPSTECHYHHLKTRWREQKSVYLLDFPSDEQMNTYFPWAWLFVFTVRSTRSPCMHLHL